MPKRSVALARWPVNGDYGKRVPLGLLALLLAGGLLVRIQAADWTVFPDVDGVYYLEQARSLAAEGVLPFDTFPPGWPLLFTPVLLLKDLQDPLAPLRAAQIVNVILGTLLGALTWAMLARRRSGWFPLAGTAMILFLPLGINLSRGALSDLAYACCLAGAWLCLDSDRPLRAGLLLGYAYLVRPEALAVPAALVLLTVIRRRRLPWRLVAGVLVFVLPYLVFARVALGVWTISGKIGILQVTAQAAQRQGFGVLVGENLQTFLPILPAQAGWPLALLSLAGAVWRPGRWLVFLLPLALIPLFPNPMAARFWMPTLPFLLLAAGNGWDRLTARFAALRRTGATVVSILLILLGGGLAARDDLLQVTAVPESYLGLRDAGLWLRERVERTTVVAAYKPYASYWGWCRFARYAKADPLPELVQTAIDRGARYLVANRQVAQSMVPGLRPLFGPLPPSIAGELTLVRTFRYDGLPAQETLVFAVNHPRPAAPNPLHTFWVP